LDRRLGGPQSRSGRGVEEKNSLVLILGLNPPHIAPKDLHENGKTSQNIGESSIKE
jgi:hypothetical protein